MVMLDFGSDHIIWMIIAGLLGVVCCLLGIWAVIVYQRRRATRIAELLQALDQRDALLTALPDLMFLFDKNCVILDCHPKHFSPNHYTDPSLFLGHTIDSVMTPEVARLTHKLVTATLNGEADVYTTYSLEIHGDTQHFESRFVPCGEHQVLSIVRNVTYQARAETEKELMQKQLLQSQKMESIGRLAGGIAHDFNNMLGVILSHTEMALYDCPKESSTAYHIREISHASERSVLLVKQLLSFARKQTITPKVIDLNRTITDILSMLQRMIGESVNLIFKPSGDVGLVYLDPAQVDQVLTNLCINARDAMNGNGNIIVETADVTLDAIYCAQYRDFIPGDYVLLTVSDSGKGMDNETLNQVFEPFFTTKALNYGTGLGLPMVYGIVKQNQGLIHVYSEQSEGTTFKIYLPRHVSSDTPDELQSKLSIPPVPQGGLETLLLVEDEPMLIKVTEQILTRLGYTVLAAEGPQEALKIAKTFPGTIDLMLTDIVMPKLNGKELADKFITLRPSTKVLYMSGYTANVIEQHGILDSSVHFISKPCTMTDLAGKIRHVLDENSDTVVSASEKDR